MRSFSSYGRFGNPFGFRVTPAVKWLLIANFAVAVLGVLLGVVGLHGVFDWLALYPPAVPTRPWTLLTYMFVHAGFLHLLFNMIGFFFFGPPLEEKWGSAGFVRFYFVAGFGGAILSFFLPGAVVVGASGAVYGVLLAYAMIWPDNLIYIWGILPIKAKWFMAALIAISVFGAFGGSGSNIAHLAHLGGLIAAFLYLKSPWAPDPYGGLGPARGRERHWPKLPWKRPDAAAVQQRADPAAVPLARREAAKERELLEDIDRILDKISQSGMDSLSDGERTRLEEVSRRYRSN
ncbi:hypothetical protein BH23GEM4_BH23GEM4_15160 [soil metagenome]